MSSDHATVPVWDPFVRISHWLLASAFFIAFLTDDDLMTVHVWAGYLVGVLVILRVLWGLVGPRHARFSDFVYRPRTVIRYMVDLLALRGQRYVGHSPAGGAMAVALWLALAATVGTGLVVYAAEQNAGPLAGIFAVPAPDIRGKTNLEGTEQVYEQREQGEKDDDETEHDESAFSEAFEEAHEVLANLTLALVIVHILGVLWASLVHWENLTRAMVTGRKRLVEK